MNQTKFDKQFISEIKKKIINYVSRSNVNINRITFNLSLYNQFIINDNKGMDIKLVLPVIIKGNITPPEIIIDSGYFDIIDDVYYIKPEAEDVFTNKIICTLVKGCSINIVYDNNKPVRIIDDPYELGYRYAMANCIAEDINDYIIPDFADKYSFNKKIIRMINAIIGKRYSVNTFFRQDESLKMMLYSLSTDNRLFDEINKLLILINRLINTLNSDKAIKSDFEIEIINKLLKNYKYKLVNMLIDELYIPYINSVGLDERKIVRDEILKGFLGPNYINLKLTDENKDSYYWASLINNTVPINNKIEDNAIRLFEKQIIQENNDNLHDLYVKCATYKSKKNIKEFFAYMNNGKINIKTGNNKVIEEPHLVEEILSYGYINSIDKKTRKKVENGILTLCSKSKKFNCSLKSNPLNNKMLVAGIIQMAKKEGYILTVLKLTDDRVTFSVKEEKRSK